MTPAHARLASARMEDPRLYRRIHADLLRRIDSGELPAGARLNIGLIADEWDTTRITVGKALRMLGDSGRLEFYAGLGWYVTGPGDDSAPPESARGG